MKKTDINSKKGFTIIEVVLVLAIAGLIFLMVFVAYPALRRNQSDTARRNDLSRLVSQLAAYKSNNRKLPASALELQTFKNQYLDGESFADPDGELYKLGQMGATADGTKDGIYAECTSGTGNPVNAKCTNGPWKNFANGTYYNFDENAHKIYYLKYATCQGQDAIRSSGKNDIAIVYVMETGVFCQSNAE